MRRSRVLRSLYVSEQEEVGSGSNLSVFASICQDLLSLIGVKVAENRKQNYTLYGRAGLQTEQAVSKFLFCRYFVQSLLLVIGGAATLQVVSAGNLMSLENLIALLISGSAVAFGLNGHVMVLDKLTIRRREKLTQDFPDSVDLLLICVESGMGLDAALARVSRELQFTHPTVTVELERTRIELGLYGDRVQALQNFAERTDLQSYRSLVSALVQTEKYGTNLASTLRTLSQEYRQTRLHKAEEKAAKVGAILTLPVVLLVFFPVMALIMSATIYSAICLGWFVR